MAIQAQMCSENIGFPMYGGGGGGVGQDWAVENGCGVNGLSYLQQKQHLLYQMQQQNMKQSLGFDNSFAVHAEKQRQEIDLYIKLQNERLRLVLQEQRKQQLVLLMKKTESQARVLFAQKDEQIAQARSRTMELEDFLRKMEYESQTWQRLAQENESMVISLNNTLEQLKEQTCCTSNNGVEDSESCCDETRRITNGGDEMMMMICRNCNSRNSCVLFLPCRHLCSCKVCESFLEICPICKTAKKASIETVIF